MKVFLGGTVSQSKWRDSLMPRLEVEYFNPVVKDWTEEAYKRELYERKHCEYCLYVLTPWMEGHYSIAEVVDDSFRKPDRTIFCYLPADGERVFAPEMVADMEKVGRLVASNGGVWLKSLDEVVAFLNSAKNVETNIVHDSNKLDNVFISYGRRHSLVFARKLHDSLVADGYNVWFDMNDIPLAVDFQEQIDDGIKKADNFVFVISPHSVKSVYCYKEIILALQYNKRIIPILHVEPADCWDKMHPEISRLNWIYCRQKEDFSKPLDQWESLDDYNKSYAGLRSIIESHKYYVRQHTVLLDRAVDWQKKQKQTALLLVDEERRSAEQWLLTKEFRNEKGDEVQAPCFPSDLHTEFVIESKKNAANMMTNVFLSAAREDSEVRQKIKLALARYGFTAWTPSSDIADGTQMEKAVGKGVTEADTFVFFLSPNSAKHEFRLQEIEIAQSFNKRVVVLLIEPVAPEMYPTALRSLPYINFTDRTEKVEVQVKGHADVQADVQARKQKAPFYKALDELLVVLNNDANYYYLHKVFLVNALRWEQQGNNVSILLREKMLEDAKTWLKLGDLRSHHKPTELHRTFIHESETKAGLLNNEVFISYSRADSDFVRRLNEELQLAGKTTTFDQENVSSSEEFDQEKNKNIAAANNFLFVSSPDAVESPYCAEEIALAKQNSKRAIIVIYKSSAALPAGLEGAATVMFDKKDFHTAFSELIRTLDFDRAYIEKHTRYNQLASEWESKNRDASLLLPAAKISMAKMWIEESYGIKEGELESLSELEKKEAKKQPPPTAVQIAFVKESENAILVAALAEKKRQEELITLERERAILAEKNSRRQRLVLIVAFIALIGASWLGIYAWRKRLMVQAAYEQLEIQKKALEQQRRQADSAKTVALDKEQQAIRSAQSADSARNNAEKAQLATQTAYMRAKDARKQALDAKAEAEKQKQIAQQLFDRSNQMIRSFSGKQDVYYDFFTQRGDSAMALENYEIAAQQYILAQNSPDAPQKNNLDDKIKLAETCADLTNKGMSLFYTNTFDKAVGNFQKLQKTKPDSKFAPLMIEACKPMSEQNMQPVDSGLLVLTDQQGYDSVSVTIQKFQLSKYEVTNIQYCRFLNEYKGTIETETARFVIAKDGMFKGQRLINLDGFVSAVSRSWVYFDEVDKQYKVVRGYEQNPVAFVSWYGAMEFCRFYNLRLPSANEWEWAAASGDNAEVPTTQLDDIAWYAKNAQEVSHQVGSKKPNKYGLFDMYGNVYEWCLSDSDGILQALQQSVKTANWNTFQQNASQKIAAYATGETKLVIGGCFYNTLDDFYFSTVYELDITEMDNDVGFRFCK